MIEVVAAIIKQGDRILLARRATYKSLGGKWEFPGGKVKDTESPEKALERELMEEFGIVTKTGKLFCSNNHDYGDIHINLSTYFSNYISGEFHLSDHDKLEWVEICELDKFDVASADRPVVEKLQDAIK